MIHLKDDMLYNITFNQTVDIILRQKVRFSNNVICYVKNQIVGPIYFVVS